MGPTSIEIVSAIVAFVGFGGLLTMAGFIWKLADRLRALEAEAAAAKGKADVAAGQCAALQKELSEFQVDAARRFVTDEMLTKVEERVIAAIERLADRLDRVFEDRAARQRTPRA